MDRRIQRYKKSDSDICEFCTLVHTYKKNIESPATYTEWLLSKYVYSQV